MKLDSIHFGVKEQRVIDGYDKPVNLVLSSRSCGKTTHMNYTMVYKHNYLKNDGYVAIFLFRNVNDINDMLLEDIRNTINKFTGKKHKVVLKKRPNDWFGAVYLDERLYCYCFALNVNKDKLKGINVGKVRYLLKDEFFVDERHGDKYLKSEGFKFRELWSTLSRENPKMKCYMFGNPYSLYNPYFVEFGVEERKLRKGEIYVNDECLVYWLEPSDELKEIIEGENRLLGKEGSYYRSFAQDGNQINDLGLRIEAKLPQRHSLKYVFVVNGVKLGCYRSSDPNRKGYWVGEVFGENRTAVVFDRNDLGNGRILFSSTLKREFCSIRLAYERNRISFESVEVSRAFETIYEVL